MKHPLVEANASRNSETVPSEVMATLTFQKLTEHTRSVSAGRRRSEREWEPHGLPRSSSTLSAAGRSKSTHRLMNGPPLRQRVDASGGTRSTAPRPVSTGRIRPSSSFSSASSSRGISPRPDRGSEQSVTRAILDLREKREQAHSRRMHRENHKKQAHAVQQQQPHVVGRSQSLVESTSMEDKHATHRLKQAETKISSLMQELDELRFFHEIETASPSPPSKDKKGGRKSITDQPMRSQSRGRTRVSEKRIRALSPRRLAAMDRTSLELEAQQLQRHVDMLMQEKISLEATIELNERTAESHDEDTKRLRLLEEALKNVQKELSKQLEELQTGRTKLVQEYEDKLHLMQREYSSTRDTANELLESLQETQEALEQLQKRHVTTKEEGRKNLEQTQKALKAKEDEWAKEKSRLNIKVDTMTQSLSDRDALASKLQKELETSKANLESSKRAKDESYELRIEVLQQQLSLLKDQYDSLRSDNEQQQQILQERDQLLRQAKETEDLQKDRLAELQSQFEQVQLKHEEEMQELKTSLEDREKQRLNDLVLLQQDSNKEYESRLKSLQEQLKLATDRHQAEVEQKEKAMELKLVKEVEAAKQQVADEYEVKLRAAKEETALINVKYEEAKEENLRRQVRSESKDRDAAREWERKDALRQGELDRMNDKLDRTSRELAEKEGKIQNLQDKISEMEQRHKNALAELEAENGEELAAREELLANQRKALKAAESKLRTELTRRESDIVDMRESVETEKAQLQEEVEQLRKALKEADRGTKSEEQLKQKIASMQASMDRVQNDFISEKARHESQETELRVEIAKLDGKLAATESTLKEKRTVIEDLEHRLANTDEQSSVESSKFQNQLSGLRRDLDASRALLLKEQSASEEKDALIAELEEMRNEDAVQLEKITSLEEAISSMEKSLEEAQAEKTAHVEKLAQLQADLKQAEEEARNFQKRLSEDKEQVSMELVRKEKHIEDLTATHEKAVEDLASKLRNHEAEKSALQSEVDDLKSRLDRAEDASKSRGADSESLRSRVVELESQIEKHQRAVARAQAVSNESAKELREQLANAELAQEEVAEKLDGLITEKAEMMEALEQVIAEVQSREEEIEALTSVLKKRDEELEHAKLIATKAIASAQEIKTRYKEKGVKESGLKEKFRDQLDEMNESLVYVTEKHDQLKTKVQGLESELQDKTMECARLKDIINGKQLKGNKARANNGFVPMEGDAETNGGKKKGFKLMEQGFNPFEDDQQSASQSDGGMLDTSMSTATAELGDATKWLEDFDSDKKNGGFQPLDDSMSEPGVNKSRRSIERDALRKYVRKRYLKRNNAAGKLHSC